MGEGISARTNVPVRRPDGEPLTPMTVTLRLRRSCAGAGITGRPPAHGWRHTAATLLIDAGTDVKTVQTRLGHSTPTITLATYSAPGRRARPSGRGAIGEPDQAPET